MQVQVTVMASYGIISLNKKLRHNCFSRLRSMSTWSLTGVDMTTGLAVTSCSRRVRVGLGVQSQKLRHSQCSWMTLAKLQVDCSAGPKPPRSAWRPCLKRQGELSPQLTLRLTSITNDVEGLTFVYFLHFVCVAQWSKYRAFVMTSGILYSMMRVEGLIPVETTLSQFP